MRGAPGGQVPGRTGTNWPVWHRLHRGEAGCDLAALRGGHQPARGGHFAPIGSLFLLTGGSLHQAKTTFRTPCGQEKHYFATDRLKHPDYRRVGLRNLLAAATVAGLDWNPASQTGAIFHLLGALEEQGRIGVTAIGDRSDQAQKLYLGVASLLDRLAAQPAAIRDHHATGQSHPQLSVRAGAHRSAV